MAVTRLGMIAVPRAAYNDFAAKDAANLVAGPYFVAARDAHRPGAVASDAFVAGAVSSDSFVPGVAASEAK